MAVSLVQVKPKKVMHTMIGELEAAPLLGCLGVEAAGDEDEGEEDGEGVVCKRDGCFLRGSTGFVFSFSSSRD